MGIVLFYMFIIFEDLVCHFTYMRCLHILYCDCFVRSGEMMKHIHICMIQMVANFLDVFSRPLCLTIDIHFMTKFNQTIEKNFPRSIHYSDFLCNLQSLFEQNLRIDNLPGKNCPRTVLMERTAHAWWRHQMKIFSALLALCAGNSPVTGEFPSQRPVARSFDVSFDLRLNKPLIKQSRGW